MLYRCTHRPAWAALRAWKLRMAHLSWRRTVVATATEARRCRRLNASLRCWRQVMLQMASLYTAIHRMRLTRARRLAWRVVATWRHEVGHANDGRVTAAAAAEALAEAKARSFHSALLLARSAKAMATAFEAWAARWACKRRQAAAVAGATRRRKRRTVARAFVVWRRVTAEPLERAERHWRAAVVRSERAAAVWALAAWGDVAHQRRRRVASFMAGATHRCVVGRTGLVGSSLACTAHGRDDGESSPYESCWMLSCWQSLPLPCTLQFSVRPIACFQQSCSWQRPPLPPRRTQQKAACRPFVLSSCAQPQQS